MCRLSFFVATPFIFGLLFVVTPHHAHADVDFITSKTTVNSITTTSMGAADDGRWKWSITTTNIGTETASFTNGHTIMQDTFPSGPGFGGLVISSSSGVTPLPSCSFFGQTLSCNANPTSDIDPGGTFTVEVLVTPKATGTYTNPNGICTADPNNSIGESDEGNNACGPSTVTVTAPDLGVTISSGGASPNIADTSGGQWTWTYSFTASGDTAVFHDSEGVFIDQLPTNASYGPVNQSISGIVGTISCAIGFFKDLRCFADGVVTISSGDTMSLDFTVTPDTAGTYNNPRGGGICAIDPSGNVNNYQASSYTCSDSVTVIAPNLTATKDNSLSAGIVQIGTPFTWVVSVANDGLGDAEFSAGEVILRDDLPNVDATYGSISVTNPTGISGTGAIDCSISSFTLQCVATGGTVGIANTSGAFEVEVTTTLSSTGIINNPRAAGICAVDPDTNIPEESEADNACSDSVNVRVFADLSISKTDGVAVAVPGTGVSYTIIVTNNGPGMVPDALVTDIFPADITATYSSVAVGGALGNTANGSGNLSETLNMPNGSSVTYIVSAAIDPSATGTLSNTANVSSASTEDSVSANNSATDSDTVLAPEADLGITKSNGTTELFAGQSETAYTITVTNNGPSDATNVVVTDTLDADLSFTSTSGCAEDPNGVPTCILGTIAAKENASFTVTTSVDGSAVDSVTNTASATSDAVDNTSENDTGTDTDTIVEIDLTIAKSNDASDESIGAINGMAWTWNVVVANTGPDNAVFSTGQTILIDQLPTTNITYGTATVGSVTNVSNSDNISCGISGGGLLTCAASGVPVTVGSGAGTFTVSFTATATVAATYTNAAATCLVDPDDVIGETDENNTCGSDDSIVVAAPDLEVVKTNDVSGTFDLGDTPSSWAWTLTLNNTGAGVAEFESGETVFSDNLPSTAVSYGIVSVGTGTDTTGTLACSIDGSFDLVCTASGGTFSLGGATGSIPVSFTVTPSSVTTYANPRAGGSCSIDPDVLMTEDDESNNICSDSVTVVAPNLTVSKDDSAASGTVDVNIPFTWVLTVANNDAGNAVFTDGQTILVDNLPNTNVSYGAVSIANVTNVTNAGNISCSIAGFDLHCTASGGALTIGATTGTFDVELTTTVTAGGAHVNPRTGGICRVDPATSITETNEADNDCADNVTGLVPDLQASKTNDVGGATTPDSPWTWTTSITNTGPGDAIFQSGERIFTDDLPDTDISYGATSISNLVGVTGSGTVSCSINASTINCDASGGTVTIADTTGSFDVNITGTPSALGTFDNPRAAGTCAVDPDNAIAIESNEGNNACSDSVLVAVRGDFGDAPDPTYPVLLSSNGAKHEMGAPLFLGTTVDDEFDGQPNASATGDGIDEDGVVFTSVLISGQQATIDIVASASGLLNAWVDFDGNGDWTGAAEQIFTDAALAAGVNSLNYAIPVGAKRGTTYARFRFNSTGGLSFTGLATDGEVEDFQVTIDSAVIGAAKQFTGTCSLPATLNIDYEFENFGTQDLFNLTSVDDLVAVLGTHGVDWTFTSISSVPASLANPGFDGQTIAELINQGSSQSLSSGSTGTIAVAVQLLSSGTFSNQVSISGTTAANVTVSDQSTSGFDPDPNGDNSPEENVASVFSCEPPTIEKAFSPDTIATGGISVLTFKIANSNDIGLSGLNFMSTLPADVVIADPTNLGGTCPAMTFVPTPVVAGTDINLTGSGVLAPSSSCTISLDVTAVAAGAHVSTTGVIGSMETGAGTDTASATLIALNEPTTIPTVPMLPRWALLVLSMALVIVAFNRRKLRY